MVRFRGRKWTAMGSVNSTTQPVAVSAGFARSAAPLHLVQLAAVPWSFSLVGRSRMLTEAWLRAGQPTTFVQVPSYRTALQRLAAPFRPADDAPVVRPWPIRPSRWWNPLREARLRHAIRRRAAELCRQLSQRVDLSRAAAIVVSPVWTPWLDELPFRHVIYDCIDDLAVHIPRRALAPLYEKWEDELVQRAAAAVVTAEPLREALQSRRSDLPIAMIRNGVDVERFQGLARSSPRPADVPAAKRPIVGFVGALYEWIDWELIAEVTRALPECDFVFVGPHDGRGAVERLGRLRNVVLLGARPYDQVPAYVQAFDVCWVPFDQSRTSRAANPIKIYEYLSLGKPVVSTPVADTHSFENHVLVGHGPAEVTAHLRAALAARDENAAARVEFARANSWDARAAEYVSFIASLAG
jgi:glycosyltransferase involved in cell wall biosynthesis